MKKYGIKTTKRYKGIRALTHEMYKVIKVILALRLIKSLRLRYRFKLNSVSLILIVVIRVQS